MTRRISIFCVLATLVGPGIVKAAPMVWEGQKIVFTKADFADWTLPENQDRITANVALTRQNERGLFNIQVESEYTDFFSPADTEWAYGTTRDLDTLTFSDWRTWHGGCAPCAVGQDAVVHLVADDIYINIKILSWTSGGQGGGFSYERSTPIPLPVSGSVIGLRPLRIECRNLTTGQSITAHTSGSNPSWDCEELGLEVTQGDEVATSATGEVSTCAGRFHINHDGTVTDCETKLVWLRDANCSALGVSTWSNATSAVASLNDGECGLMDDSVEGDWRLPTPQEWERLVESAVALGLKNPSLVNTAGDGQWQEGDAFRRVVSGNYWSSRSSERKATVMRLSDGLLDIDLQSVHNYAWPVREALP